MNPLEILQGRNLSSVEFVQNYVQLRFDGPTLTAITPPRIQIGNRSIESLQPGYRDALCDQIGNVVRNALTIPEQEIRIEFQDGSSISISLDPKDLRAAESAIFDSPPSPTVVWQ